MAGAYSTVLGFYRIFIDIIIFWFPVEIQQYY